MSSVSIQGNASGTGIFTIASPNSNTNRTLTLPDATGTIITTAGGAAISGTTGAFTTTVGVGGATPAASGAGITFPATQSASSDANTLDDYEEGTWTPGVSFGGASVGVTYSSPSGTYTKVGRQVTCVGRMVLSNKGSSTGVANITGLPFTVASGEPNYAGLSFSYIDSMTFAAVPMGRTNAGSTNIDLSETSNAGAVTDLTNSDFANGTGLRFIVTYFV
jgi:hypothetical protein